MLIGNQEKTEFISCNREPIVGKENILKFFVEQRKTIYTQGTIVIANVMEAVKDFEQTNSKCGDKFVLIDYLDIAPKCTDTSSMFIETDGYFITKMVIKNDFRECKYVHSATTKFEKINN